MDVERINVTDTQDVEANKDEIKRERSTDLQDFIDINSGLIDKITEKNNFAIYKKPANNHEKVINIIWTRIKIKDKGGSQYGEQMFWPCI